MRHFIRSGETAHPGSVAALAGGLPVDPNLLHVQGGGTLADAGAAAQGQMFSELGRRLVTAPRGAWLDAPPAEGRFPLIVVAHGLGGSHSMWSTLGEFLASHGYVVAAPTFISDGSPSRSPVPNISSGS